jgi:hypothetical protein
MSTYPYLSTFTGHDNLINFNLSDFCSAPNLQQLILQFQTSSVSPGPFLIPTCISQLRWLNSLQLKSTDTSLSGPINAVNWTAMTSLQTLSLDSAGLSGALPLTWPSTLTTLTLNNVVTSSSLSDLAWNQTTSLTNIQLNNLYSLQFGTTPGNAIPTGIVTLSIRIGQYGSYYYSLTAISLSRYQQLQSLTLINILSGTLSADLASMPNLSYLDLSSNQLTGSLSVVNWNLMSNLAFVLLNFNNFTTIGSAFSNMPKVQQLYIESNPYLSGTFPPYLLQSSTFNQM